jgi:hypothetical protein
MIRNTVIQESRRKGRVMIGVPMAVHGFVSESLNLRSDDETISPELTKFKQKPEVSSI